MSPNSVGWAFRPNMGGRALSPSHKTIRFVPLKFEEIFSKHAQTHPNALTLDELQEMLKSNRQPKDYKGWLAAYTEWKVLYTLCKDKDVLLHKDTIRAVYDGSLFEHMEKGRASNKQKD